MKRLDLEGVRGLGEDGLARPSGPAEGPHADRPLATPELQLLLAAAQDPAGPSSVEITAISYPA